MGICLSCLRGPDDDDQSINENTPLIHDGDHDYDKGSIMRKREEELNNIVNETNENLIDITSFFNPSASMQDLAMRKSLATLKSEASPEDESEPHKSMAKLIPNEYVTAEEKSILKDLNKSLFDLVEQSTKIQKKGPLIASFD